MKLVCYYSPHIFFLSSLPLLHFHPSLLAPFVQFSLSSSHGKQKLSLPFGYAVARSCDKGDMKPSFSLLACEKSLGKMKYPQSPPVTHHVIKRGWWKREWHNEVKHSLCLYRWLKYVEQWMDGIAQSYSLPLLRVIALQSTNAIGMSWQSMILCTFTYRKTDSNAKECSPFLSCTNHILRGTPDIHSAFAYQPKDTVSYKQKWNIVTFPSTLQAKNLII